MEIRENGFYLVKDEFIELIKKLGGEFNDKKERPMFCCLKDERIEGLYWIIPTSDLSHRTPKQIDKYRSYEKEKSIRSAYYYIGTTNRPALFKISKVLPITEKYFLREYNQFGKPLVLGDKKQIAEINAKLQIILTAESRKPNRFEQHITDLKNYLCKELSNDSNT